MKKYRCNSCKGVFEAQEDCLTCKLCGSAEIYTVKEKNKIPKHYDFKIQPLDVIDDWNLDFYRGNAVKYIARAGRKGSAIEDIDKAIHYLELYKKRILNGGSKKEK